MTTEDASLLTSFRRAFKANGWPTWPHAIQLSPDLQSYARQINREDPSIILPKARDVLVKTALDDDTFTQIYNNLEDNLIQPIYGSNQIESAGSSWEITVRLCRAIFRGLPIPDLDLEEKEGGGHSPEYEEYVAYLESAHRNCDKAEVIRPRREVTQHAEALVYLITQVVFDGRDLTEELILKTHAILCERLGGVKTKTISRDDTGLAA